MSYFAFRGTGNIYLKWLKLYQVQHEVFIRWHKLLQISHNLNGSEFLDCYSDLKSLIEDPGDLFNEYDSSEVSSTNQGDMLSHISDYDYDY